MLVLVYTCQNATLLEITCRGSNIQEPFQETVHGDVPFRIHRTYTLIIRPERSGSVVECLTRDRRVAGSSLTGVTALWSLSKTHLS